MNTLLVKDGRYNSEEVGHPRMSVNVQSDKASGHTMGPVRFHVPWYVCMLQLLWPLATLGWIAVDFENDILAWR